MKRSFGIPLHLPKALKREFLETIIDSFCIFVKWKIALYTLIIFGTKKL